jgi:hypothetical protein
LADKKEKKKGYKEFTLSNPPSEEDVIRLMTFNGSADPNSPATRLNPAIPEASLERTVAFGRLMMDLYNESVKPENKRNTEFLSQQAEKYLEYCTLYNQRITNQGFYYALGVTGSAANLIAAGKYGAEMASLLQKIQSFCSMLREQYMANSDIPVPVGIFWQKNYDGFKDNDNAPLVINIEERKSLHQLAQEVIEFDDYSVDED